MVTDSKTTSDDPPSAAKFKVALVQMTSGRTVETNLIDATARIRAAAKGGAQYIQTPEVTTLMELERERLLMFCNKEVANPALAHFRALAQELNIWLHIGSMPVLVSSDKLANRSYLISPQGRITGRYDKIHMFDVELPDGERYEESKNYQPGTEAVVADLPWGGLGMTICYDLRFPYLHRALAKAGAKFIAIPAAFTVPTGKAHWHTLIRARAIEAQCFVFAAAQCGTHEHGRKTFGHSLIVSPWGDILAEAGNAPEVIFADIDLDILVVVRAKIPSLQHDRDYKIETSKADVETTT